MFRFFFDSGLVQGDGIYNALTICGNEEKGVRK